MPRRSKQWLAHFGDEPQGRIDPLLRRAVMERVLDTTKDQWFRDSNPPGFAIKLTPNGHQSFTYDYRQKDGRTKRLTFRQGKGVDVTRDIGVARAWAHGIAAKLAAGGDPTPAPPASY